MITKKQIASLFLSIDFCAALLLSIFILFFSPDKIAISFLLDIFGIAISVLSIVFSVYFAALAIIITSGDNEFIDFLEEDGSYSHIIWTFKITLLLLFFALVASIILYVIVLPFGEAEITIRWFPKWGAIVFCLFSSWSLFAAALATLDAIKYAEYRARFISIINDEEN